jgi:tetratricopeptide (TPR) repeat protein
MSDPAGRASITGSGPGENTPVILEGFRPVSESIDWLVADVYWAKRGAGAFLSGDVPHVSTNDGTYAARAADLLFANCLSASREAELEATIRVLELGVGPGLHARLLLDRFRERCRRSRTDFYDRLTYFATDASPKMLCDLEAAGTLDPHRDHVSLAGADALNPSLVTLHGSGREVVLREVRGVLCNYLLDVLPYDVVLREDGQWFQLRLRTLIDQSSVAHRGLADEAEPTRAGVETLLEVQGLFASERAYFPVNVNSLPFGERLTEYADEVNLRGHRANGAYEPSFVHSHGALMTLTGALRMLRADGFVLCNDYGSSDPGHRWDTHQRYGGSRAVPVNFALLDFLLSRDLTNRTKVHIPPGDGRVKMHSRLLTLRTLPDLESLFALSYDAAIFEGLLGLVADARKVHSEDIPATRSLYQQVHDRFPENWAVSAEWSQFEVFVGGDIELGLDLARQAASINPTGWGSMHDVLGDALVAAGKLEEAHGAYSDALRFDSDDIRAHAGVGWVSALRGQHDQAISEISTALSLDRSGEYQQMLLAKLTDTLNHRQEWSKKAATSD